MRVLTGALESPTASRGPPLPSIFISETATDIWTRTSEHGPEGGRDPCFGVHSASALDHHLKPPVSLSASHSSQSVAHMLESGMALHRGRSSAALITNLAPGASRASRASVQGVACLQASTNGGCQVHQVDAAAWQRRAPTAIRLDASPTPTP